MDDDNTGSIEVEELKQAFEDIREQYEDAKRKDRRVSQKRNAANNAALENMQTLKVDLLDGLTDEKIRSLLDAVDQDQNGGIDYSEFLAHSLTANQLSEKNIRLFFDVMRPVDLNKAYNKTLKDNYDAGGEENVGSIRKRTRADSLAIDLPSDCVDARAIHKYF